MILFLHQAAVCFILYRALPVDVVADHRVPHRPFNAAFHAVLKYIVLHGQMPFVRCCIGSRTAQQRSASHAPVFFRALRQPFGVFISQPAADKLVIADLSAHLWKLLLHRIYADPAKAGQVKQIVRNFGISVFLVTVPVDGGVAFCLGKKIIFNEKSVHAARKDRLSADLIAARPPRLDVDVVVKVDVIKHTMLYPNILAPNLVSVFVPALHQPDAAGLCGALCAGGMDMFPPAVDKPDVFASLHIQRFTAVKDHVLHGRVLRTDHVQVTVLVSLVSPVHHAVALAQRRCQRLRVVRLSVSRCAGNARHCAAARAASGHVPRCCNARLHVVQLGSGQGLAVYKILFCVTHLSPSQGSFCPAPQGSAGQCSCRPGRLRPTAPLSGHRPLPLHHCPPPACAVRSELPAFPRW